MVKITSPLMSRFASGTLGSTIQFRGGPGGSTTGLTRPRKSLVTASALRSYANALKMGHRIAGLGFDEFQPYAEYAKKHEISTTAAYLHFGLTAWKNGRSFPLGDPTELVESPPGETTIAWNDDPEPGQPNLTFDPFNASDMLSLHLMRNSDETTSPKNCIHMHWFEDEAPFFVQPELPQRPFWLQAATWTLPLSLPTLSNKLTIE